LPEVTLTEPCGCAIFEINQGLPYLPSKHGSSVTPAVSLKLVAAISLKIKSLLKTCHIFIPVFSRFIAGSLLACVVARRL